MPEYVTAEAIAKQRALLQELRDAIAQTRADLRHPMVAGSPAAIALHNLGITTGETILRRQEAILAVMEVRFATQPQAHRGPDAP